jgi:hypothetical protein
MELKWPGLVLIGLLLAAVTALVATGHSVEGMTLASFLGGLLVPSPLRTLRAGPP